MDLAKLSSDKSNLSYTESKAKFTHTIKMVYTGTATASADFARSMQLICPPKYIILCGALMIFMVGCGG